LHGHQGEALDGDRNIAGRGAPHAESQFPAVRVDSLGCSFTSAGKVRVHVDLSGARSRELVAGLPGGSC